MLFNVIKDVLFFSLESTNHHLRQQLDSLDMLQQEYRVVEIQHRYVILNTYLLQHKCFSIDK